MHLLAPSLGFEIQQHLAASHLTPLQCMYLFAPRVLASKSSSTSLLHTSPVYAPACTQSRLRNPAAPRCFMPLQCMHLFAPRVSASKSSSTSLLHTSPVYAPACTQSRLRNPAAPRCFTPHASPVIKAKAVHFTGEENCKYKDSLKPKKGMNK
ncbi:uncharacterized protein LOC111097788 isoform X4 [Canis lupus familiaris]|uniref:uncharacterized protein LOC111097788 isoform X4 n=1 Tax=Canis lupus familiaris TaxID=9615 RepID=UPI0018F4C1C3|nr:uncharacterized protein LOC111097788 isoform X4 [Canis lupus familiaris]